MNNKNDSNGFRLKAFQLTIFLVSLWFFNLAIISSYYERSELTFKKMFNYADINPISSFSNLAPLSNHLKSEEEEKEARRGNKAFNLVERRLVSPAHKKKFDEVVYKNYFHNVMKLNDTSYSDYVSFRNNSRVDNKRKEEKSVKSKKLSKSETYQSYFEICQQIKNRLLKEGMSILNCDKKLLTVNDVGSVLKTKISSSFRPVIIKLKQELLSSAQVDISKEILHYQSSVFLVDYDKSKLLELCRIGVDSICEWIEKPIYSLKFYYSYKHKAKLLANQSDDTVLENINFSEVNQSILLEVSDVPVSVDFSVHFERDEDLLRNGEYLLYSKVKIYIEPQLSGFESLLSPGYLVESFSVDISLTVYERLLKMFTRVFASVPGALTVMLSLFNMIFLLNLLFRRNYSGLKKTIMKQTQHD